MHAAKLFFFWARINPEQPAVLQSDMALTYGDLKQAVEAISGGAAPCYVKTRQRFDRSLD